MVCTLADDAVRQPAEVIVDVGESALALELDVIRMLQQSSRESRRRRSRRAGSRGCGTRACRRGHRKTTDAFSGPSSVGRPGNARGRRFLEHLAKRAVHDRVGAAVAAQCDRVRAQQRAHEIARPSIGAPGLDFAIGEDERGQILGPLRSRRRSRRPAPRDGAAPYCSRSRIAIGLGATMNLEQQRRAIALSSREELAGAGDPRESRRSRGRAVGRDPLFSRSRTGQPIGAFEEEIVIGRDHRGGETLAREAGQRVVPRAQAPGSCPPRA